MPSGQLCPRQDRTRCPLHGPIVPRDEAGAPLNPTVREAVVISKKKKRPARLSGMRHASLYAPPPTARTRIEKKIFQKSVVKRVAAALNAYDARRAGAKFADQFNYAIQR